MRRRLLSLLLAFVMVLGMLPVSAFAAGEPFTITVNGAVMDITESENINNKPCYLVKVPETATEATLSFEEEMQWMYYNSAGVYLGQGATSTTASKTHTVAIQDAYCIKDGYAASGADGELDGISVQVPNSWTASYYIMFDYASSEDDGDSGDDTPSRPFTSIKIGGTEVAEENIIDKGTFYMGDYAEEEQQENTDSYDYVHDVPYYHVTVPCGTTSVNVTYPADTPIMNYGADAYGYKTDLEVDATTSATVRSTTFKNGYTKNEDGTQTVATPVTGYTFDAEGNGHAITLEETDAPFKAICLFAFKYDGVDHVYDEGIVTTEPTCTTAGEKTFTCSCGHSYTEPVASTGHKYDSGSCTVCGAADPDFQLAIPEGTNIQAITAVTEFTDGEKISFSKYGNNVTSSSYIATVPENTQSVTVTFKSGTHPAPYGDSNKLSGAKVSYQYDESWDEYSYKMSGKEAVATQTDGLWSVELSVADFLLSDKSYYGAYDSSYNVQYLLTFRYPEGTHVHSYTESITKEPSCYEVGTKTFTCSGCAEDTDGHSYTQDIPMVAHTYGEAVETKAADCVNPGENTYTCSVCPEGTDGHTKTETVKALSHQYDDGVVTTDPTCTTAGEKTYTCTRVGCTAETSGHTKTETINALGHNYQNGTCANNCGATCPLTNESGAFLLTSYEDLKWFANAVKEGLTTISAKQTADITVGDDWEGIGTTDKRFAGTFDGGNHTVTFNGTKCLFAYAKGSSASECVQIRNVVTAGNINGSAGIAEDATFALVENCINRADVSNDGIAAGIVGQGARMQNQGAALTVKNCGNEGDITSTTSAPCAGILGHAQGNATIEGCYNTGSISGCAAEYTTSGVGGIAGYLQGYPGASQIINCYNGGTVTGGTVHGGLVGSFYNGVSVSNSYNAGQCEYGIMGSAFNDSPTLTNVYYLDTSCTAPVRNYQKTATSKLYLGSRGEAVSSADLGSAAFAATLGTSFKESCGGPVLSWQEAKEHTGDGICTVCKAGSNNVTDQALLNAIKSTGGYEIVGADTITKGYEYKFTVKIKDGYEASAMKVKVNGTEVTADTSGQYSVTPNGHFYITVEGVNEIPDVRVITLPKEGDGYRVVPCENYSTTVSNNGEFKFKVNFINGFKAGDQFEVQVTGSTGTETVNPDNENVYTISNITEAKTIAVKDVEIIPIEPLTVKADITQGPKNFYKSVTEDLMLNQEIKVPYFELSDYGLEAFYYNPNCYVDANGNPHGQRLVGNRETAYGKVTVLHALIYMTDLYYLNYGEQAGTGKSYQDDKDAFKDALKVTQVAGSSFIDLWNDGTNLNYHVNYEYLLAYTDTVNVGSTCDQQLLADGDRISIHFITGAASGSAFGFFAANDEDNTYDKNETIDYASVKQGETIKLTHYIADQGYNYTTAFKTGGNKELYWVQKGWQSANVEEPDKGDWNRDPQGDMTADAFKTDANGEITIDTTGWEVGTYYIAAQGGFTKGDGSAGADGFVSAGTEAGPAYFTLEVTEGDSAGETPDEEIIFGDVDGDKMVGVSDVNELLKHIGGSITFTEDQLRAANVDGDAIVAVADANEILKYIGGSISQFPCEQG